MERLHECLLHNLPVGGKDARDVHRLVAILKRPLFEVAGEVAEKRLE